MLRYDKTFHIDGIHYIRWHEKPEKVLTRLKAEYKQKGFTKIAPFAVSQSIPNTYTNDKRKAPETKSRPITNCSGLGAKAALKVACQALAYLLKRRETTHRSCNLQDLHKFPQLLREKAEKLMEGAGPDAHLMFLAGDVADMYTELPHHVIKEHRNHVIQQAVGSTLA